MIFFFSSRRRHTRSDRDWSSDVCSSDLVGTPTWRREGEHHNAGACSSWVEGGSTTSSGGGNAGGCVPLRTLPSHGRDPKRFAGRVAWASGNAVSGGSGGTDPAWRRH